jgi:hypothetical protein
VFISSLLPLSLLTWLWSIRACFEMSVFRNADSWHLDIDRYLNRVIPASPLHKLPTPVSRFLGYRKEQKQDVGNILGAFWSFTGAFCGLAVIAAVFNNTESIQQHAPPAFIASFVSGRTDACIAYLTGLYRVHRRFWSTMQSARRSDNHETLCLDIRSQPPLAWASPNSFNIIQSTRKSSG